MAWKYTHCQNVHCKYYWEDSCTRSYERKMTALDNHGRCMHFEEGESDWYETQEATKVLDCPDWEQEVLGDD